MISRSFIERNLKYCDGRFRRAKSARESLFYSKLALMELCGWIEISMDDIVLRCAKRKVKKEENTKFIQRELIKRNNGFDYEINFRKMLIGLVGLVGIERLERKLDQSVHSKFVSTLKILKSSRDAEAHTYVKGITRNIDAPSLTISHFFNIYAGLCLVDKILQELGY